MIVVCEEESKAVRGTTTTEEEEEEAAIIDAPPAIHRAGQSHPKPARDTCPQYVYILYMPGTLR